MARGHLPLRQRPRDSSVGLLAVLTLAALLLLAAGALSAPATQMMHLISYLPLVNGPPPYRIAYVRQLLENPPVLLNYEIFVINADGSNQTNLTNSPRDDDSPAWSPDGRRIAFRSGGDGNIEFYAINTDGSHQTKLAHFDLRGCYDSADLAWSPDGKRIAFTLAYQSDWESCS